MTLPRSPCFSSCLRFRQPRLLRLRKRIHLHLLTSLRHKKPFRKPRQRRNPPRIQREGGLPAQRRRVRRRRIAARGKPRRLHALPLRPPITPRSSNTSTAPVDPPAQAPSQHSNASKECPPSKIIVRQGGTKEPSIQLAGGTGNQAARKSDGINELLWKTYENLKKTSGMQLTTGQQDTVTQTRQFMEQSKAAMSQGDFERARTLAWKAQLLSDDLVKPEK